MARRKSEDAEARTPEVEDVRTEAQDVPERPVKQPEPGNPIDPNTGAYVGTE